MNRIIIYPLGQLVYWLLSFSAYSHKMTAFGSENYGAGLE